MNALVFAVANEEEQLNESISIEACHTLAGSADMAKDTKRESLLSGSPAGVIRDSQHSDDVADTDGRTFVVNRCEREGMVSGHNAVFSGAGPRWLVETYDVPGVRCNT